ncbi:hypothetical protein, partial [Pseudomonas aeruginosa]|uniref:hypothetical protein n=1 Tax=Pseudomonas aeruginosa TaxID=287 RepID=UPI003D272D18
LMAMRRGIGEYMGQYNAMKKAIGFNPDQAAAASNRFMTSLRSLSEAASMARDKIGSNLADGLAGSLDRLRRQILENFPKIDGRQGNLPPYPVGSEYQRLVGLS